ncbi:hypothetical protein, partial [Frankia sp. ACN1ag]
EVGAGTRFVELLGEQAGTVRTVDDDGSLRLDLDAYAAHWLRTEG